MSGKQYFIGFCVLFLFLLSIGFITFLFRRFTMNKVSFKEDELPGAHIKKQLEGYSKTIQSNTIVSFSYSCGEFDLMAEKVEGGIHITSIGGDRRARDGSAFHLDYVVSDTDIMMRIQNIILKYKLLSKNGFSEHVNGLPAGLGDTLSVTYDSDEKIYMTSNQAYTVMNDANLEFYDLFRKVAIENGYNFNTELSNVEMYDDADYQYLQGIWKGNHFGNDIWVSFIGNTVEIRVNGIIKDSCEYIVMNGFVRKNELRSGVTEAKNEHDYLMFQGVSSFAKKNDFILVGYFLDSAYSTCELLKQE